MLKLRTPEQRVMAGDFQMALFDTWRVAAGYFNHVTQVVEYFPQDRYFKLDTQIRSSASLILDYLAQGSNTASKKEFEQSLHGALESLYLTISSFLIAHKWNYLRKDLYNEVYQNGKLLANRIRSISQDHDRRAPALLN